MWGRGGVCGQRAAPRGGESGCGSAVALKGIRLGGHAKLTQPRREREGIKRNLLGERRHRRRRGTLAIAEELEQELLTGQYLTAASTGGSPDSFVGGDDRDASGRGVLGDQIANGVVRGSTRTGPDDPKNTESSALTGAIADESPSG